MAVSQRFHYFTSTESLDCYWRNTGYIPDGIRAKVSPYLLPYDHPARAHLDRMYSQPQITNCTKKEGREVTVIFHPELQELNLVVKKPHLFSQKYTGLLKRVVAHQVARQLIEKKNITQIKVPQNWLYPLPAAQVDWQASVIYHLRAVVNWFVSWFVSKPPRWLRSGSTILLNRFILVEESINIQIPTRARIDRVPEQILGGWKEVFEAVGFQDAHELNYSLDDEGMMTLFDLDQYSKNETKNRDMGRIGYEIVLGLRSDRSAAV